MAINHTVVWIVATVTYLDLPAVYLPWPLLGTAGAIHSWQPQRANAEPKPKVPVTLTGANIKPQPSKIPKRPSKTIGDITKVAAAVKNNPSTMSINSAPAAAAASGWPSTGGRPSSGGQYGRSATTRHLAATDHRIASAILSNQESMQRTLASLLGANQVPCRQVQRLHQRLRLQVRQFLRQPRLPQHR